jgi:5-methylcytosine-specific restriction endonuclease McrA
MNRKEYREYLQSDKWKNISLECKEKAGFKCERCGKSDIDLHAHHKTYARV